MLCAVLQLRSLDLRDLVEVRQVVMAPEGSKTFQPSDEPMQGEHVWAWYLRVPSKRHRKTRGKVTRFYKSYDACFRARGQAFAAARAHLDDLDRRRYSP